MPPPVDDADPCTVDGCDAALGVTHAPAPAGVPCPDANPCNGEETCDGLGVCAQIVAPAIDDGDPCTFDACDPATGITHIGCAPLDLTLTTTPGDALAFLWSGPDPIQSGVAPGAIDLRRAAAIRGVVRGLDGAPLPGVTITIQDHGEYGSTHTYADGAFTMAVSGGGPLVVSYQADGYLPVARSVEVPWLDYAHAPDVVLTPLDPQVTTIDLSAAPPYAAAHGSLVADADGARRATVLFPPGTTAHLLMPGGALQPISTLSVRATEYTVGDTGPEAMPATLPPTSAYTYAVELSVDEALAAGALSVEFNQPLPFYVDNFLGFPVGTIVPVGYYDRARAVWVASENGRVLQVLGASAGLADVDTDGDGLADDAATLAGLGITDDERVRLAQLYPSGASLWRTPIQHMTPFDCNWGYSPPEDACYPMSAVCVSDDGGGSGSGSGSASGSGSGSGSSSSSGSGGAGGGGDSGEGGRDPGREEPEPYACVEQGSIIDCENQTLGESIPLAGTPYTLHYQSDRVPGYQARNVLTIPLSRGGVPASLESIELVIEIAGRRIEQSFPCPCASSSETTFQWDGKDAFGRDMQGEQPVTVRIGYAYTNGYAAPRNISASFGEWASAPGAISAARGNAVLWKQWQGRIGGLDARPLGLGGWTLSAHHVYSPGAQVLHLGDGRRRVGAAMGSVIRTVAGDGTIIHLGDGGPAPQASVYGPSGVAIGADGSVYIGAAFQHRIRRVGPDGIITTYAGNGTAGGVGDGGPATAAQLSTPRGVALGPDGSLYIAEQNGHRIRRIAPDGVISTVAGTGVQGFGGDGGPATQAQLNAPFGVAVAGDGTLYIADTYNHRIRRVGTNGIISTAAGDGTMGLAGDGGPAALAKLRYPRGAAVMPDGGILVADTDNNRVRRVDPNGIIRTFAGTVYGFSGDEGPATEARLNSPRSVAVGPDGTVYVADQGGYRIRRIGLDGVIHHLAGVAVPGAVQEGVLADGASIGGIAQLALGPDRGLYLGDMLNNRVRRISPTPMAGVLLGELMIPAEDGREAYVFSGLGRHLRTIEPRTGATLLTMHYGPDGLLTSLEEADGDTVTINRDPATPQMTITGPFLHTTTLVLNADGYLETVTNPASETTTLTYWPGGLLNHLTDALQRPHTFNFDGMGRLVFDGDPEGGSKTLTPSAVPGGRSVTVTTGLGRSTSYAVERPGTASPLRSVLLPTSLAGTALPGADGLITTTLPDGRVITYRPGADPRFGMLVPFRKTETLTTPGGRTWSLTRSRTAMQLDPGNLLNFSTLQESTTINGKTFLDVFTRATRTLVRTTPAGRQVTTTLDTQGRVVQVAVPGIVPMSLVYDSHGRLETVTQGARTVTRGYWPDGYLATVTDPLSQMTTFTPGLVGRVEEVLRPDGETVLYDHDAVGNLIGVTPPGQGAHIFGYSGVDQRESYDPPPLASGPTLTSWDHDIDRKLDTITRPDGVVLSYLRDPHGRLQHVSWPGGVVTRSYHPTTGKLNGLSGPGGVALAFTYDGHLLTDAVWSGAISGAIHTDYNNHLRASLETVNGAHAVSFAHDDDGLLTGAGSLTLTRSTQNGRVEGLTVGSVVETLTFDGFGDLDDRVVTANGAAVFAVDVVQRDALGRIIEKTETIGSETHTYGYSYDLAGRLDHVYRDGMLVADYEYDANGNRTSLTTAQGQVIGVPDAQDRLETYGTLSFTYKPNGELESRTDTAAGETTLYSYDPLGNLRQVTLPGGAVIEYLVDGRGRRVGKKVNGARVLGWLYRSELQPAAELDASGAVAARFVYGERVNVPDVMIKGGVTYRLVTDHLGSVRLVVDTATGVLAQRIDYDEFGRVVLDTSPGFQPFGFAGGLYDPETGLMRFGARDYDAETGRWTAKDPLLFDGGDTNLYSYALGDPINRVDPVGRAAIAAAAAGGGIIVPVLVVAGVFGLCILMASWLDEDLIDGFPPVWPENDDGCRYVGETRPSTDTKICMYHCPWGPDNFEVVGVWPCPGKPPRKVTQ